MNAPFAIVTVPVGVLAGLDAESTLEFVPPLPIKKLEAIRHLASPHKGACTHEKVVLRWETAAPFVRNVLDPPGAALQFGTTDRRFHFLNLHKYGRRGQILCHIWADAEWHSHRELSDDDVVAEVVSALRAIFPGNAEDAAASGAIVPEPRQATVTRWALDPLALGAYSEMQDVAASERGRQIYAETEGRVLFAGEGAIPGSAGAQCTHGALLSGVSAALEVMATRLTATESKDGSRSNDHQESAAQGCTLPVGLLSEDGPLGLNVQAVVDMLARTLSSDGAMPSQAKCAKLAE